MHKTLYTTKVSVQSGRNGHARSSDGLLDLPLAMPVELGGPGGKVNPEQLLGAGFAACFGSSLLGVASQQKISIENVSVDAEVQLLVAQGVYSLQVNLTVSAALPPGILMSDLIDQANAVCAYTNAFRGNAIVSIRQASPADKEISGS